jgi:predicted lipoprotein with Yx(FWY)xxD motif
MKRISGLLLFSCVACRDKPTIIDRGGRSLDVPVPSTGVAASGAKGAEQDITSFPKALKTDPTEIGTRGGRYGMYLVDKGGRALYVFSGDAKGETACVTNCASVWPPAIVKSLPTTRDGVVAAQLTLITRPDGSRQLAYAGLPLYYSDSDLNPDDTWGHYAMSFGGRFSLVGVDGKPLPPPK